jgi:hypothetical protein
MAFIEQQEILDATSGGLDIIYSYYPQAKEAQTKADKRFKVRDEKTASASLKQLPDGIWVVTDFGGDQTPRNGIQVCQKEESLTFREAIVLLAGKYSIGGIKAEVNKPGFEKRPASPEEKEGEYIFDVKEAMTTEELKVLGPKVTAEVCERYHYFALNSFTYIKGREALITRSTEKYPIFLNDHTEFKKIYQPLNPEKQYRFRYVGNKPKDYINGLDQLVKAFEKFKTAQLKEKSDDESPKIEKLEEAIICSGDRDALNVAGFGYLPLWLNSESAHLTGKQYKDIMTCVKILYNLPDIDETGIREMIKLGLEYLDIHHIVLPDSLRKFKDPRGRSRKDFLDYIEIYSKDWDFKKLINVAKPLRFWVTDITQNGFKYNISSTNTRFFLQANGFYQIENKNSKTGQMFIQVLGNVVREVQQKDIKAFLIKFCEERYLDNKVLELLLNTNRLSEATLLGLKQIEIDFTDYDHDAQYLFFKNKAWKVTSKDVIESRPGEIDRYVWQDEVIPHNVKKIDDFFNITEHPSMEYDIEVYNTKSKYFAFLINASRIHWRRELEKQLEDMSEDEADTYRKDHKFNIAGPKLSEEEIWEQKHHLINKIFSIGYLLHRYKTMSKAWCVFAMDNIIGEEGESNGRSGKSTAYKALRFFMKHVTLPGRNPKLTDNPHLYDRVTEHTDYVLVDDADQYLNYKFFYDSITGELIVNPKNNQSYEIPFEKAPKFVFTSNHAQRNIDPSLEARLLYTVFSDYYHQQSESNDYASTWGIRDDFNKDLFGYDYSEEEWNNDFNFFAQCIKFYLSVPSPRKINPPMKNVTLRNMLAEMGQAFKDWADAYFDLHGNNVDQLIAKDDAFNDFIQKTNMKGWSTNKFTKSLRSWCRFYGFAFNPKEYQNSQKRISRKVDDTTKDMVYVRTKTERKEGDPEVEALPYNLNEKENMPF